MRSFTPTSADIGNNTTLVTKIHLVSFNLIIFYVIKCRRDFPKSNILFAIVIIIGYLSLNVFLKKKLQNKTCKILKHLCMCGYPETNTFYRNKMH